MVKSKAPPSPAPVAAPVPAPDKAFGAEIGDMYRLLRRKAIRERLAVRPSLSLSVIAFETGSSLEEVKAVVTYG